MKRELNSRSRRKWVAGGVLAFGSVALLSTGFATWVIGANNMYQDGQLTVVVDSAENNSFFFEFDAASSNRTLNVREDNINLTYVKVAHSEDNTPMQITLSNVKVTAGADGGTPSALSFELVNSSANEAVAANIKVAGLSTIATHAVGGTYVAAPASIADPGWGTPDTSTGVNVWTIASLPLTFTWGTFFDNSAPSGIYNDYLEGIATDSARIVEEAKVAEELNAMQAVLTGNTLTLRVTVAKA